VLFVYNFPSLLSICFINIYLPGKFVETLESVKLEVVLGRNGRKNCANRLSEHFPSAWSRAERKHSPSRGCPRRPSCRNHFYGHVCKSWHSTQSIRQGPCPSATHTYKANMQIMRLGSMLCVFALFIITKRLFLDYLLKSCTYTKIALMKCLSSEFDMTKTGSVI